MVAGQDNSGAVSALVYMLCPRHCTCTCLPLFPWLRTKREALTSAKLPGPRLLGSVRSSLSFLLWKAPRCCCGCTVLVRAMAWRRWNNSVTHHAHGLTCHIMLALLVLLRLYSSVALFLSYPTTMYVLIVWLSMS